MGAPKKVRRGDSLRSALTAEAWNEFVDTSEYVIQQRLLSRIGGGDDAYPHPAVVTVENRSGKDLPRFGVVQLAGSAVDPAAFLEGFQEFANFKAVIPANPPDPNRWAVLLEPLAASSTTFGGSGTPGSGSGFPIYPVGRAVLAGAVACKVLLLSTAHDYATPAAGITDYLVSGTSGPAVILSKPLITGIQWCQVQPGRCCVATGSIATGTGSGGSGSPCACTFCEVGTVPDNWCISFPGIANGACLTCADLAGSLILGCTIAGNCVWSKGIGSCGIDYVALVTQNAGGSNWQWAVYVYASAGLFALYESAIYPSAYKYPCNTPVVLNLVALGAFGGACTNWPLQITAYPGTGPCAGSGSGSGTGTGSGTGGGCAAVVLLGTYSSNGTPAILHTTASITVDAGATLLVAVMTAGSNAGTNTVVFGVNAMTLIASQAILDVFSNQVAELSIWQWTNPGTSASGAVAMSTSSSTELIASMREVDALIGTVDEVTAGAGVASLPTLTQGGAITRTCEYELFMVAGVNVVAASAFTSSPVTMVGEGQGISVVVSSNEYGLAGCSFGQAITANQETAGLTATSVDEWGAILVALQ